MRSDEPRRVAILIILADILGSVETPERVRPLIQEACAVARRSGREDLVVWTDVERLAQDDAPMLPADAPTRIERSALEAEAILTAARNDEALAHVALIAGDEAEGRGQMRLARERFLRAAAAARRAEDALWAAAADGRAVGGLILGPEPADVAIAELRSIMESVGSDRPRWVNAAWRLGMLLMRARRYEEGRRVVEEARAMADEIGYHLPWIDWWLAMWGERFAGDPERALKLLDGAEERWPILQAANRNSYFDRGGYRAALLCDAGRPHEAIALMRATGGVTPIRDAEDTAARHGTWARALARTGGSRAEALEHGRAAVALADQTDRLDLRADMRLDLADVLDSLGEKSEAMEVVEEALAIYARKGLNPPARRLHALGVETAGREPPRSP